MIPLQHYVYFVTPIDATGPIKIGYSHSPEERLAALMTWSPVLLEIVVRIKGDAALERKIHRRFARYHSHGEWFHANPELLGMIAKLQIGVPLNEAIDLQNVTGAIRPKKYVIGEPWTPGES